MARKSKLINKFAIGRYYVRKAKENARKRIEEEESLGTFVDDYSKKLIRREEMQKAKRKFAFTATLAGVGLSALIGIGIKSLPSTPVSEPTPIWEEIPENDAVRKQYKDSQLETPASQLNTPEESTHDAASFKEQYKVSESELYTQEGQNVNADFIIQSFVDSYNEEMGTDLKREDLKYFSTNDNKYLYKNESGNYVFDYNKSSEINSVSSCDIACIIDANTMEIIYADGKIKDTSDSEYEYNDNIYIKYAELRQHYGFSSKFEEGKGFHSDKIYLDDDLKGKNTTEEAMYNAISEEIKEVEQARNHQDNDRDI